LSRVSVSFDEKNLVPNAGLLPAAVLAQRLDLAGLVDRRLHLVQHSANSGAKALSVIGSMLVGGDSIDEATAATLRRKVFTMPGRLVHTGRCRRLRLPANWPWADPVLLALTRITAIPLRC